MAAFLLLPMDSGTTLADVDAWIERARTLGASAISPVQVGASPLAAGHEDGLTLSVRVTVTRSVVPATESPRRAEVRADHDRESETETQTEIDSANVPDGKDHTVVEDGLAAQREPNVPPRPTLPVFSHPS